MKSFLFKIRYAIEFRRLTHCDWKLAWQDAESWLESFAFEQEDPREAAAESVDAWACSQ